MLFLVTILIYAYKNGANIGSPSNLSSHGTSASRTNAIGVVGLRWEYIAIFARCPSWAANVSENHTLGSTNLTSAAFSHGCNYIH